MSDHSQAANPTDTSQTSTGPSKQNPLDALEKLLQDAKKKKGTSDGAEGGVAGGSELSSEDKGPSEEEQLAELAKKEAAKKQQEAELLKQEMQKIKVEATQSPQAKARTEQNDQKNHAQEAAAEQTEAYQIRQLGHSKI